MTPSFPNEAMPDEALYTLLCKYLLDEADTEERAWVETWKEADPGNMALLVSLGKVLDTAAANEKTVAADTPYAWSQLQEKMDDKPALIAIRSKPRFTWLKIAAVLLIALGAGWWFLLGNKPQEVYAGPVHTTLTDGSNVQLSDGAKLEVARGFNEKNRKVTLTGTASFDVKGSAANPFVITLGHNEVKVLGTRFMIDYQPGAATLKVHVSNGKVMVIDHDKQDSVLLTDGMLLQKDNDRPAFRIASHVTDMGKRSLSFQDTPLEEVLHTITEVYDIKVEVMDTDLLKLPVRADFTGESTEDVMKSLALMLNAHYEKVNDRQYKLK
ncbi:FecR family protein [Chitinophaga arvensicola]|uniref:Ferric-dicitrate binding protein FerR, regulates iron transport through sigma-19 n=1 Tax=Chitinophaga arvensicola TaxID=29529 RepID=A0A1I0QGC3_9BACT|nr:FecR domain-containing protein [Chitinophaga arvensicola]SEW26153.1 ferric-dicitrate binding protein FerR, regulates iron transport through sigma-19 [Chitinophaga arvensicola]